VPRQTRPSRDTARSHTPDAPRARNSAAASSNVPAARPGRWDFLNGLASLTSMRGRRGSPQGRGASWPIGARPQAPPREGMQAGPPPVAGGRHRCRVEQRDLALGRPAAWQVAALEVLPGGARTRRDRLRRLRRWENGSVHQIRARRACLPPRTRRHITTPPAMCISGVPRCEYRCSDCCPAAPSIDPVAACNATRQRIRSAVPAYKAGRAAQDRHRPG
jgi:hypothetical protein